MKKKCTLSELIKSHPHMDYRQIYHYICKEIEEGRLEPVKASKLNGKKPALYNSYWEIREEEDYREVLEEITYRISPMLDMSYYRKNPRRYAEDAEEIRLLSEYLVYNREKLDISETINERSFEIFHREKFLDREKGRGLLARLGIDEKMLHYYETSVPMSYYSHYKRTPQNFLIIENKDTFYSMRKHLIDGNAKILGLEIGTLIYGGGKGIYRSFADFVNGVEPYFGGKGNRVYYFGDLDYEGIAIYENLAGMYQLETEMELFVAAYQRMLEKAEKIGFGALPRMKEGQNERGEMKRFFGRFSLEEQEKMGKILKKGYYIPQEILNVRDYGE